MEGGDRENLGREVRSIRWEGLEETSVTVISQLYHYLQTRHSGQRAERETVWEQLSGRQEASVASA